MTFQSLLGLTVHEATRTRARLSLTVTGQGTNMHGTAHGGLLYSLADEAFAVISNQDAQAVAVDTHMSYFQAARPGDHLTATATPERIGRTLATYRVEIHRNDDLIALFTGTVSRREKISP